MPKSEEEKEQEERNLKETTLEMEISYLVSLIHAFAHNSAGSEKFYNSVVDDIKGLLQEKQVLLKIQGSNEPSLERSRFIRLIRALTLRKI